MTAQHVKIEDILWWNCFIAGHKGLNWTMTLFTKYTIYTIYYFFHCKAALKQSVL